MLFMGAAVGRFATQLPRPPSPWGALLTTVVLAGVGRWRCVGGHRKLGRKWAGMVSDGGPPARGEARGCRSGPGSGVVRAVPRELPVSLSGVAERLWARYRSSVRSSSGAVLHSLRTAGVRVPLFAVVITP